MKLASAHAWLRRFVRQFLLLAAAVGAGNGLLFQSPGWAAPPQLTSLFPTGVQGGQSVDIEAKGKFEKWPTQVWVDRPGLQLQPAADKGKLKAVAAADAEPGVYWFRLFDEQGTTPPFPLIVGHLPETSEHEPNDRPGQVQEVAHPSAIVNGKLGRRGDVDIYAIQLKRGQTLVAELNANRTLEAPVDGLLEIVSSAGFVLARNDDHQGLDPRVVFVAPQDGTYLVRTFGFPATPDSTIGLAGGDNYLYRLLLTTESFIDYTWPLAVSAVGEPVELTGWNLPEVAQSLGPTSTSNPKVAAIVAPQIANRYLVPIESNPVITAVAPGDPQRAQSVTLPTTVTGRIGAPRESNSFTFAAPAGATLVIRIESRELGFPLDPVLELFDATGKSLVRVDDTASGRDAELVFAVPAAGEYRLMVSDLHRQGGARFVYRLRAALAAPDYSLGLAADSYTVAAGSPLEVPVKIERLHGFNQPIVVKVEGLPEGVQAEAVTSPAEGDLSKEVKLQIKSGEKLYAGPIQVTGRVAGSENLSRQALGTISGRIAKTNQPWLTITPPTKP